MFSDEFERCRRRRSETPSRYSRVLSESRCIHIVSLAPFTRLDESFENTGAVESDTCAYLAAGSSENILVRRNRRILQNEKELFGMGCCNKESFLPTT